MRLAERLAQNLDGAIRLRASLSTKLWQLGATLFATSRQDWAKPICLACTKAWIKSKKIAEDAACRQWRRRSGFPTPGWAQDAGFPQLFDMEPLSSDQSDILNYVLSSAETPWADPQSCADLKSALSAKARQLAFHPLSSLGGSHVLDLIPPSASALSEYFRRAATDLDPLWHARGVPKDILGEYLLRDDELMGKLDHFQRSQAALAEADQMATDVEPPVVSPSPKRPRL